jgi:hypothetical protein
VLLIDGVRSEVGRGGEPENGECDADGQVGGAAGAEGAVVSERVEGIVLRAARLGSSRGLRSSAGTVQISPEASIAPLKSCTCCVDVPVPGTKRSNHMNPMEPNKRRHEPHHRAVDSRPPSEAGCGVISTRGWPLVVNYGEDGSSAPLGHMRRGRTVPGGG